MTTDSQLQAALAAAARHLVQDAFDSLPQSDLDRLALSGPANAFAVAWERRPTYQQLAMLLTNDAEIRPLLKPSGREAPALYSFFVGTTLMALQLPAALLASSLFDHLMLGNPRTVESVVDGVVRNIERLRLVSRGGDVDCRWVAGLVGLRIPSGARCDTAIGSLRPVEQPWLELPVWQRFPAEVLVSGDLSMQIKVVQPEEAGTVVGDMRGHEEAINKVRALRLAILLSRSDASLRPQMTVMTAGAPHLGWIANLTESTLALTDRAESRELSPAELEAIPNWCGIFAGLDTRSVSVAIERTLSAATERIHPTDVLIDSVMAWESLFGTEFETTFRTTAAMACVLEKDHSKRRSVVRGLQETYRARSRVVHGEPVDYSETNKHAELALDFALQTLRVVFSVHPWLLSLRSSRERADAVLLGDPRLTN